VSEEILRIGSSLFLHGDVVDLKTGAVDLATVRKRYADIEPQLSSMIFATLVSHFRLNAIEYLRHSKAALAKKILGYLRIQHPSDLEGTNAIYFGHTHVPFANFLYEGIRFYNSGSLIRGLRWNPVEF
jgi:UDP-2,3-diacylglucosamine hydrolase